MTPSRTTAQLTDLETKLAAAQKDAVNAAIAKDATEDSVKAKLQAVADLETQIAMERYSKGVKPIVSGITDDQKSQLDAMPNGRGYTMAYGQLFGGGRGGFGGRRGGGFGGGGGGFGGGGGGGGN